MTSRIFPAGFRGLALFTLTGLPLLAACMPEPLPSPTARRLPVSVEAPLSANAETAPRKMGVYPTFSAPLKAANSQMSDEEAAGLQGQLSSLSARRASGAISEAEYQRRVEELRKLAAGHGAELEAQLAK